MEKKFYEKRRQTFLVEEDFKILHQDLIDGITLFNSKPAGSGDTVEEGRLISVRVSASHEFNKLVLNYTAGEPIEPMRYAIEDVVIAYERYVTKLREYEDDQTAMAFPIRSFDGYCPYIWLISLCYLLHRRDLLPRVASLVDGEDRSNGGSDWIIEELLAYNDPLRYDTEVVIASKPYMSLADALSSDTNEEGLEKLQEFLKRWYKDLAAAPWHDSHKEGGGYYGYWAFEAAAAVILLDIKDDSSLHQYLYYPKDIVEFARSFKPDSKDISLKPQTERLRCEGGQPCPRTGYWSTPAREDSRRHFKQGEIMPDFESSWGDVIWGYEGD